MPSIEIMLKNNRIKSYRFTALLLVVINLSAFVFISTSGEQFLNATLSFGLLFIYIIYRWYQQRKAHGEFYFDQFSFVIIAGGWIILHHYWATAVCLLLGGLYHLSLQNIRLVFNDQFITKLNFPKKEYAWSTLSNVILRDGILTLDFVNNKLFQQEIEEDDQIDEADFNEYARMQIRQSALAPLDPTGKN
jgi:hypothetical protein